MSATLISLLAVTIGFGGLVLWVYWPSHKEELESLGSMPLEDIEEDTQVNSPELVNSPERLSENSPERLSLKRSNS